MPSVVLCCIVLGFVVLMVSTWKPKQKIVIQEAEALPELSTVVGNQQEVPVVETNLVSLVASNEVSMITNNNLILSFADFSLANKTMRVATNGAVKQR